MHKVCLSVCSSQSGTSFCSLRLFDVLMKLCYRLSMTRNPNPSSDFAFEFPLVRNSTNQMEGLIKLTNQIEGISGKAAEKLFKW
jgi:hypothetical protein